MSLVTTRPRFLRLKGRVSMLATALLANVFLLVCAPRLTTAQQTSGIPADKPAQLVEKPEQAEVVKADKADKTDTTNGAARRNENVQFNLVDNNAQKEQNTRLGTTATIVREFTPDKNYFGAEFGNAPKVSLNILPAPRAGIRGDVRFGHLNSIFSARTFFQVGSVQPAHENDYGFNVGAPLWQGANLFLDGGQRLVRGSVNGNVLVPRAEERTPLATDPAVRIIVARFLAGYPAQLPDRTDIDPRALNTNSRQNSDADQAGTRLDQKLSARDRLALQYQFSSLHLEAFQLVAEQNPDTDTKSHLARLTWNREWNPATLTYLAVSYDRQTTLLQPEKNAVGPLVRTSGLEDLGPQTSIPINRAQNNITLAGLLQQTRGNHHWTAGFGVIRRQINGSETESHRGFFLSTTISGATR